MALVLGKNSYADLYEAEFYFENRLDASSWTSVTDEDRKEQALIAATYFFDRLNWRGVSSSLQEGVGRLAWARSGYFFDPVAGRKIDFTDDYEFTSTYSGVLNDSDNLEVFLMLPREIQILKHATFEQAYHFLNNPDTLDTVISPTRIRVGSIELDKLYRGGTPKKSKIAYDYLKPLLADGFGSRAWRRTN